MGEGGEWNQREVRGAVVHEENNNMTDCISSLYTLRNNFPVMYFQKRFGQASLFKSAKY
jgi:hypothetical protein